VLVKLFLVLFAAMVGLVGGPVSAATPADNTSTTTASTDVDAVVVTTTTIVLQTGRDVVPATGVPVPTVAVTATTAPAGTLTSSDELKLAAGLFVPLAVMLFVLAGASLRRKGR